MERSFDLYKDMDKIASYNTIEEAVKEARKIEDELLEESLREDDRKCVSVSIDIIRDGEIPEENYHDVIYYTEI